MSEWNFEVASQEMKGELLLPDPQKNWSGASIDTRTLKTGNVFFALSGSYQDGHDFLWDAFRKGASGAVIRREFFKQFREKLFRERALFHNLILVSDPEEALAALAGRYRSNFSAVGVGITGSVGKTGTKEFLYFLLSQKYPVLRSSGNRNNHLGLPLTLFELQPEHQYCIAELGASRQGEIRRLSHLLKPEVGVITCVTAAHLEGFGSVSRIYDAKLELADALAKNKGTLVLPDHDAELIKGAKKRKVPILFFGRKRSSDFRLSDVHCREGWVEFELNARWTFRFPGFASFQAENAVAALSACFACGVSPGEFPSLWKDVSFAEKRFEVSLPRDGVVFINDCYNANPYSFERALEAFDALEKGGRKILVLGDMLELGSESAAYHRALGQQIQEKNFQAFFSIGHWMREATLICEKEGNPPLTLHFEDKGMLSHFLGHFLRPGDQVLFKASRGIKLEEVVSVLSFPLSLKRAAPAL